MSFMDKIRSAFVNWGGRFSGRYRSKGSFFASTYQWLSDVPDLSEYEDPYSRAADAWMSPHDQYRLQLYKFNRSMYAGDHYDGFRYAQYLYRSGLLDDNARMAEIFGTGGSDVLFLAMNLFGLITDTFADLITEAMGPVLPADDSDEARAAIRRITSENSDLKKIMHQSVTTGSYKGDIVWTVHWQDGEDKKAWIRPRRVDTWFPTIDPTDRMRWSRHDFCFQIKDEDKRYVAREIYDAAGITLQCLEIDGNTFKGPAPPRVFEKAFGVGAQSFYEVPGGLSALSLVIHIPNKVGDDNDPYGDSDYGRGVLTLADELNHRLTQLAHQLDKHGDPMMSGPEIEGDDSVDNTYGDNTARADKYVVRDDQDVPEPKYVELPTSHLQIILNEIDMLCEEVVRQARMTPRLLGYKKGAAEEAYDTLRLACISTLLRNKGRIDYIGPGVIKAVAMASALEKALGVPEAAELAEKDLRQKWGDGFPVDTEKQARIHQIRTANKPTESVRQAIQDMDGPEGAKDTLEEIREEDNQDMNNVPGLKTRRDLNLQIPEEPEINAGQEPKGQNVQGR